MTPTREPNPKGFLRIPDEFAFNREITAEAKLVLGVLIRLQGKSASCYPSQRTIARMAGISLTSTWRAVNSLIDKGVVRLLRPGENRPSMSALYEVPWLSEQNQRDIDASREQIRKAKRAGKLVQFKQGSK